MQLKWIIESFRPEDGSDDLIKEVRKQGIPCDAITYQPFKSGDYSSWPDSQPIVFVGSINLAEQLRQDKPSWRPGIWTNFPQYDCLRYMSSIGHMCLNGNYIMIPFADLWRQRWLVYQIFSVDSLVFIRPNAGTKEFTGALVDMKDLEHQLEVWRQFVKEDSLVLVSRPQKVTAEWRIIVACYSTIREVVASSLYMMDGNRTYVEGSPEQARELAMKVTEQLAPPDVMYAIDVACLATGEYKVVEINAFGSCGLYACNKERIVSMATRIASDIYKLAT